MQSWARFRIWGSAKAATHQSQVFSRVSHECHRSWEGQGMQLRLCCAHFKLLYHHSYIPVLKFKTLNDFIPVVGNFLHFLIFLNLHIHYPSFWFYYFSTVLSQQFIICFINPFDLWQLISRILSTFLLYCKLYLFLNYASFSFSTFCFMKMWKIRILCILDYHFAILYQITWMMKCVLYEKLDVT